MMLLDAPAMAGTISSSPSREPQLLNAMVADRFPTCLSEHQSTLHKQRNSADGGSKNYDGVNLPCSTVIDKSSSSLYQKFH